MKRTYGHEVEAGEDDLKHLFGVLVAVMLTLLGMWAMAGFDAQNGSLAPYHSEWAQWLVEKYGSGQ